jgi:hypothetical protein
MERRKDYRHGLRYELTLTEERDRRVLVDLVTTDVSASGLRFRAPEPHDYPVGTRFEVRMLAELQDRAEAPTVPGLPTRRGTSSAHGPRRSNPPRALHDTSLMLSTSATLVRAQGRDGAVRFDAPLKY